MRPAALGKRGRPSFQHSEGEEEPFPGPSLKGRAIKNYFFILGHSQPFEQSLQHEHSHLQLGQSLQQSFEQQEPLSHVVPVVVNDVAGDPAMAATIKPAVTTRPLNNFVNM